MKEILLELARQSIESVFSGEVIDREYFLKTYPFLNENRATFVTLTIDGNLRGCIGSIVPHRTILDDVLHNAKSAAFEDPRFEKLTFEEFQHVKIEVSILTLPKMIEYSSIDELKKIIKPNIHGVIIKKNFYQATFLPQVWEQLPTFELFFAHLCQKAGMGSNCLSSNPEIYLYEVEKISK